MFQKYWIAFRIVLKICYILFLEQFTSKKTMRFWVIESLRKGSKKEPVGAKSPRDLECLSDLFSTLKILKMAFKDLDKAMIPQFLQDYLRPWANKMMMLIMYMKI